MATFIHKNALSILASALVFFFGFVTCTYAAEFTHLVGIPGLTDSTVSDLPTYINKVYLLIITIGALFGVVKIAFAGVKYSMSDVISTKQSAKDDIKGVLIGLGILLIPFMVLNTINPELTNLNVLSGAKRMEIKSAPQVTQPTATDNAILSLKQKLESGDDTVSDIQSSSTTTVTALCDATPHLYGDANPGDCMDDCREMGGTVEGLTQGGVIVKCILPTIQTFACSAADDGEYDPEDCEEECSKRAGGRAVSSPVENSVAGTFVTICTITNPPDFTWSNASTW